jgi:hypothetical protein
MWQAVSLAIYDLGFRIYERSQWSAATTLALVLILDVWFLLSFLSGLEGAAGT